MRTFAQILVASLVGLAGYQQTAAGGTTSYQCLIKEELHVLDDGALRRYPQPQAIGKRFAIDRRTGTLVGSDMPFWSLSDAVVTVLAQGNSANSFVVSFIAPALADGVHTTLVRIEEFSSSTNKPFMVFSGGGIYSGLCE